MSYLKFYFAIDEDEFEEHESILTKNANMFDKINFVRRCYASYNKIDQNVGKAFDEEGHTYNYVMETDKVFRSKEPDPRVVKILEEMNDESDSSFFGY